MAIYSVQWLYQENEDKTPVLQQNQTLVDQDDIRQNGKFPFLFIHAYKHTYLYRWFSLFVKCHCSIFIPCLQHLSCPYNNGSVTPLLPIIDCLNATFSTLFMNKHKLQHNASHNNCEN